MPDTTGYEVPLGPANELKIIGGTALTNTMNVGTLNAAIADYVDNLYEQGDGVFHRTVLEVTDLPVTVANTTGASFGGVALYTLPSKPTVFRHSSAYFTEIDWAGTDIATGGSGDYSLGTTVAGTASLASTNGNVLASAAMLDPFVSGVGRSDNVSVLATAAAPAASGAPFTVFLNVIIDDADVSDAASDVVLFTGRIVIEWIQSA